MDPMHELHVVEPTSLTAEPVPNWAGLRVPPGHTIETGYAAIHDVVIHASLGHHLYPAEVERAYRRQLELGDEQGWPPPTGCWREDGRFVLTDGRNRYVAALMLGTQYILVAWLIAPRGDITNRSSVGVGAERPETDASPT
jgi:hypothetical protein